MAEIENPLGAGPLLRTPHPGPRSRELLERVGAAEATAALTFGLGDQPPVLSRAQGAMIEDPDGNVFLDMVAGFGSLNLGHSHPRVVEAATRQLSLGQQAMSIAAEVRTQLLERMTQLVPGRSRAILGASGSEAMETALKLVRRATGKAGVVTFGGGFHGRTMGALALMGRESQRRGLGQLGARVEHLPYPDPERSPFGNDPDGVAAGMLDYIDSQLGDPAGGWDDIGAVVIEPVQGNGGMIPAPAGFLEGLRRVCDAHDVLLVLDEVMSGFCRTGRMFAYQHENASPDLLVVGKSLSGGLPLSGCIVTEEVEAASSANSESSTYAGNLVSCAAALAALDVYEEEQMSDRAAVLGEHLVAQLRDTLEGHPSVGVIRGKGLMVGVGLVGDNGEPLPVAREVTQRAIGKGLLLYAAGHFGDVVAFLPPIVATEEQLDIAAKLLAPVLDDLET